MKGFSLPHKKGSCAGQPCACSPGASRDWQEVTAMHRGGKGVAMARNHDISWYFMIFPHLTNSSLEVDVENHEISWNIMKYHGGNFMIFHVDVEFHGLEIPPYFERWHLRSKGWSTCGSCGFRSKATMAAQVGSSPGRPFQQDFYALVICYITMENHNFWWKKPLFLAMFHTYVNLPEGIIYFPPL